MFSVIMTLIFGSPMEVMIWKAGWKFALTRSGAQCVMTFGITKMQLLCAGSWDMQRGVSEDHLRNQYYKKKNKKRKKKKKSTISCYDSTTSTMESA